jgi:hypothetical protein
MRTVQECQASLFAREIIDLLSKRDYKIRASSSRILFLTGWSSTVLNPQPRSARRNTMKQFVTYFGLTLGHSFFPFAAIFIILGTIWWGPWITLLIAAVLWYAIGHIV